MTAWTAIASPKTKRRLLTNIVTFLPTLIALRGWSLPKDLTHDQYIDGLVDFMMRGLGLVHLERDA